MSTPHEVKKTSTGRSVLQVRVTEKHPDILVPKLSAETRALVLEALGLSDTAGLVVGELSAEYQGIPAGAACARYYGSEGYVIRAVDMLASAEQDNAPDDIEEDPPADQGERGERIDAVHQGERRERGEDAAGFTDPETDPTELEEAHERITHEIGARIEAERDQLRREVATLKVDVERLTTEKAEVVKALNGHLARAASESEPFQAVPPPRTPAVTARMEHVTRAEAPRRVATASQVKATVKKLNAKRGKSAGRSSKK